MSSDTESGAPAKPSVPAKPSASSAEPRSAGEMLARAREFLARKAQPGGETLARREAELTVAHALGLDRLHLFLELERPVTAGEVARARQLLVRRGKGEPVAYLTGLREFYGRPFAVDRRVLIPRPESELLVDLAREALADRPGARVLDVGTGSGCLAVTLALELEGPGVLALDLSPEALAVARANAEALGAEVTFLEGDGPEALQGAERFDLIVCNPPYVEPGSTALEPQVREWEPGLALYLPEGDPDHWLRRLLTAARERLAEGGCCLVELGFDQAARATELARAAGLPSRVHEDLAGVPRVWELRRA